MNEKVRIGLAFIVSSAILLSLFGFSVYAEENEGSAHISATQGNCGNGVNWTFESATDTLTITGEGMMSDYGRYNPSPWNEQRQLIRNIVVEKGVTHVGDYAFYNHSNLTDVSLPNGLLSIGGFSFQGCSLLENIEMPDTVTDINESAFYKCEKLSSVALPEGLLYIGNKAFGEDTELTELKGFPGNIKVKTIGSDAFYNCTKCETLKNLSFNTGLETIGERAFAKSCIVTVSLPDSVTTIETNAFQNCIDLKEATLPDSVSTIGNGVFEGCTVLEKVKLPRFTDVTDYMFHKCTSLKTIELSPFATFIGIRAFKNSGLKSISLPGNLEGFGWEAFSGTEVKELIIPKHVADVWGKIDWSRPTIGISPVKITIPRYTTKIHRSIFDNSPEIIYEGTEGEWNNVEVVSDYDVSYEKKCSSITYNTYPDVYYELAFCSNGGTEVDEIKNIKEGDTVELPVPEKEGYSFDGWYTSDRELIENDTPITYNYRLYADWISLYPEYTVRFNSDGGEKIDNIVIQEGKTIAELPVPKRDGYTFLGWFTERDGEGTEFTSSTPVNSDLTLYASWDDNNAMVYTVTFESNGGSAVAPQKVKDGKKIKEPEAPTKEGSFLSGWYRDEELRYQWDFDNRVSSDMTLYAKWISAKEKAVKDSVKVNGDIVSNNGIYYLLSGTKKKVSDIFPDASGASSADKKIAKINKKGVISFKKDGGTVLSSDTGKEQKIKVFGKKTISKKLSVGEIYEIPDDIIAATCGNLKYTNSSKISVSDNYAVKAVSKGTVKITYTQSGKTKNLIKLKIKK